MRHRDGNLTEVMFNAAVYRDAEGYVLGMFASARDVTAHKRAGKQLTEQRAIELERLADLESFQRLAVPARSK